MFMENDIIAGKITLIADTSVEWREETEPQKEDWQNS